MTGRVTWDDGIGNVFDNAADAVEGIGKEAGAALDKAKSALDTFIDVCNTTSSLGTTSEAVLDQIARSPLWTVSGTFRQKEEASQASTSVDDVKREVELSGQFAGETADQASKYGANIVNLKYSDVLTQQASTMDTIAEQANSVIEYVRDQRDSLPGSKLDAQATAAINGVKDAIVSIPGMGLVLDTFGWSDPVGKINMFLGNQREKAAEKLLKDVKTRFEKIPVPSEVTEFPNPEPDGEQDDTPPTPEFISDIASKSGSDGRVPGPGTYLGGGAYDLNGDGRADYYDYNLDGVPDVWVDSDGDGIPDIYDSYDDSDLAQRQNIEDATEQVRQNIQNGDSSGNGGGSGDDSGSGNTGPSNPIGSPSRPGDRITRPYNPNYPSYPVPSPDPGRVPDTPVPPVPGPGSTVTDPVTPVVDVDSGMSGSTGFVPGSGFSGGAVSFGSGTVGGMGGAAIGGMTAGGAVGGVAVAAGVSGGSGSYFSNVPVSAQVTPGGMSGVTGMAAGLGRASGAGMAAGSGTSAGRAGMMGAPSAGAADKSKNRRQGLGYVAPHLEDDEIEIRSVGAMAGHRIKKTDD